MKKSAGIIPTFIILIMILALCVSSCASGGDESELPASESSAQASETSAPADETSAEEPNPAENAVLITLSDSGIEISDNGNTPGGATASGSKLTISAPGEYLLSGKLSDGQIIVEVTKDDKVTLYFDGVDVTSLSSAPFWSKSSDRTTVVLIAGSQNVLTDAAVYTDMNSDDEPNSCLFSKDDLTIKGSGSLTVNGNCNNGITSKNDLKIKEATIVVNAKNNGLKGNDSVTVESGDITIVSKDDGIKVTNEDEEDKGFILIEGGRISITSNDDALQSTRSITVTGGNITVKVGGKKTNCDGTVSIAAGCMK